MSASDRWRSIGRTSRTSVATWDRRTDSCGTAAEAAGADFGVGLATTFEIIVRLIGYN